MMMIIIETATGTNVNAQLSDDKNEFVHASIR